jgi:hypothetical protein
LLRLPSRSLLADAPVVADLDLVDPVVRDLAAADPAAADLVALAVLALGFPEAAVPEALAPEGLAARDAQALVLVRDQLFRFRLLRCLLAGSAVAPL